MTDDHPGPRVPSLFGGDVVLAKPRAPSKDALARESRALLVALSKAKRPLTMRPAGQAADVVERVVTRHLLDLVARGLAETVMHRGTPSAYRITKAGRAAVARAHAERVR